LAKLSVLKKALLIGFLSFLAGSLKGQATTSDTIDIAYIDDSALVSKKVSFFIDSSDNRNGADPAGFVYRPLSTLKSSGAIPGRLVTRTLYLRYVLQNSSYDYVTTYFTPGQLFSSMHLFKMDSNGKALPVNDISEYEGFMAVRLAAGEKATFYQQLEFGRNPNNVVAPIAINHNYLSIYQKVVYNEEMTLRISGFVLSGVLLMMILFMGANYYLNGKKEFLYNGLYSICMFGLIFIYPLLLRTSGQFYVFFLSYLDFILLGIGTIFYIAFTRKFLDTSTNHPLLDKIFRIEEIAILLIVIAYSYIHFFTPYFWLEQILETSMKVATLIMGIVYIIIALRQKNRLMNYLAIGNAVLILFAIASFVLISYKGKRYGVFTSAYFYYSAGIVLEIVFFIVGLIYKNRTELVATIEQREAMKLEAEKKEFEARIAVIRAQQEERDRISADMHDDLGSGMTAIRLYSELAKKKLDSQQVPEIDRISTYANDLLNKMNAIIWTMSSSNDTLGNLISYIRGYTVEYFDNTGIDCKFTIPENIPAIEVAGEKRRNIFLTVKETLNNALKHAACTQVHLSFEVQESGMNILLHDNGKGIDLNNLREFGNGLKNMTKRMNRVGCDFKIENKEGTLVTLFCNF
jgi:signal transduction histidine kinase